TYGVICSEWVPYESESDVLVQGRLAFPDYLDSVLAPAVHFTYVYDDCRGWTVHKGPTAQRLVTRSNIPTLILSGSFDAIRLGKNRGANASQLNGPGHPCGRPLRSPRVSARTARDSVVPRRSADKS